MKTVRIREIAYSRSGDKGDISNVCAIPYAGKDYELLLDRLTVEKVGKAFNGLVKGRIERYEFPGLKALNFVMYEALGGGVSRSLCLDTHGKSRGSIMQDIEIEVPDDYVPPARTDGEVAWTR